MERSDIGIELSDKAYELLKATTEDGAGLYNVRELLREPYAKRDGASLYVLRDYPAVALLCARPRVGMSLVERTIILLRHLVLKGALHSKDYKIVEAYHDAGECFMEGEGAVFGLRFELRTELAFSE